MSKKNSYPLNNFEIDDKNIVSEPYIAWELNTAASKISSGLFTDILETIQSRLKISNHELSDLMMISPRTLDRRKKEKTLPSDESERSYRIARLTDRALQVFEDPDKVAKWFSKENYALGNKKPIDLAKTEPGAQLVDRVLNQIEYGITV